MSYMETHASLEVPAVAPPQDMWTGISGTSHSSLDACIPVQQIEPAPFVVGITSSVFYLYICLERCFEGPLHARVHFAVLQKQHLEVPR